MKVTAILGSPRVDGNTDTITARILDGAREAGHETDSIALRHRNIKPCVGCERCWSKGRPCVFQDGMPYNAIAGSDILIFSTPVYWYGPTAIMKAFMDRLVPLNRPQGKPMIEGKAAILVTAYEEETLDVVEPLVKMYELSFAYLGLRFIDKIIVPGVGPKGAVLEKPDALDQAYNIGRRLIQ